MSRLESLRQLLRQSHYARAEDLPEMVIRVAPLVDATALVIYLVDHQQRDLKPLLGGSAPPRQAFGVDGTLAGRAFTMLAPCASEAAADGSRLWLPLLNGSERLGVLEVVSDTPLPDDAVDDCIAVASLLAEMVVTRSLYSDTLERARRREPMQLAAEMLRTQLPPLTFSTGHLVISGILEPAYDVGGDAFDYAVNGDIAHLALFDAVGHGSAGGMHSVVLASIALAGYRNARRSGMDLVATYHHIDNAVRDYDRAGMITAVLAELHQRTGVLRVISAGHPGGIVIRQGQVVKVLPTPTALPVALGNRSSHPWSCRRYWNPATGSCSIPTESSRLAPSTAKSSASSGSSRSRPAPQPTSCRRRRPPDDWCTPSSNTSKTSYRTTPPCSSQNGTVQRQHQSDTESPPGGQRTVHGGRVGIAPSCLRRSRQSFASCSVPAAVGRSCRPTRRRPGSAPHRDLRDHGGSAAPADDDDLRPLPNWTS
nr:hypothetical protein GCM10020092_106830 [Actinoplanes digitatis]